MRPRTRAFLNPRKYQPSRLSIRQGPGQGSIGAGAHSLSSKKSGPRRGVTISPVRALANVACVSRLRRTGCGAGKKLHRHKSQKTLMFIRSRHLESRSRPFRPGIRGALGWLATWLFLQFRLLRCPTWSAFSDPASARAVPARLARWSATSVVLLGTMHAVSGASGPAFSSALEVQVQVATPFTYRIAINQAWPLNSFDAKPLPTGLTVNKKLGIISGKPTVVGTNEITITASQDNLPDRTLSDVLTLRVTGAPAPPLFSVNPLDTEVVAGSDVTLTSEAIGTGTLRYQWYRGLSFRGTTYPTDAIDGATSPLLVLPHVGEGDGGYYFSAAANAAGTNFSVPALVGVVLPPTIDTPPADIIAHEGATAWFYVYGNGGARLNFQWRKDGKEITGATNDSIYFFPVEPGDAGGYDVVLDNAAGRIVSSLARLTVVDPVQVHMTHTPAGSIALQFNSIPRNSYSIYYTDVVTNLFDGWFYLADVVAASTNTLKGVVTAPPGRFFRVVPD